jgi:hypothetical protein
MLGDDVDVAEVADVVDHQQPTRHAIPRQLVERVEVEMAEALMPEPWFVILACGETQRLGDVEMQDVIGAAAYLDE